MSATVGQTVTGGFFGSGVRGGYGFWSGFTLPPKPPVVVASQGDLEDRIQVSWTPDPLSPAAQSFKVYRDNFLLTTVDGETFSFMDFNVIAGRFYTYSVSGVNTSGEGNKYSTLGLVNPNGVITGKITSASGNPVPDAVVTISPTLGSSVRFTGDDMAFAEYNPKIPREQFTLSAWVRLDSINDGSSIFDMGSTISKNWWLHTLPSSAGKGVRFGVGKGTGQKTELDFAFPSASANDWHNIAISYNGSSLLLYVDGELVRSAVTNIVADSMPLFFGQAPDASRFFKGHLDEVRFFNRQLAQTEIQLYLKQSGSSDTKGLVSYWKFDEGTGTTAFDITNNRIKAYLCGPEWELANKPSVVNSAVSNETGFYKIAAVSYGAGTTFTVRPEKNFYYNQSLEFNATNGNYANLTRFDLRDSATITLTLNAFDLSGKQAILSKADASGTNQFTVYLNAGNIEVMVGNNLQSFGSLGLGFHHLAFVLRPSGSSLQVTLYKNGSLAGTKTFGTTTWEGLPWKLGAFSASASTHKDYFTGLVDEVAFFSKMLSVDKIVEYATFGTAVTDTSLVNYFNLNEGMGTALRDIGSALSGNGQVFGAIWSTVTGIVETLPHKFTPSARLATLTPSNTSVDQVDFTDQSTIPVSGYVRMENTNCFQANVEILVNGKSHFPAIFTDSEGKFSAEFEPGANIRLTPKFQDHTFFPAFWEILSIASPTSGILFRNEVKRKVIGQVAGGLCRQSIIPTGAIAKVKVATLDGCYEQIIQLQSNGKFTFNGVPPDSVVVSVIEHSNPIIYNYFQNKGGQTIDLRFANDTVDFIYIAPPNVELTPLDTNQCGNPMLTMLQKTKTTIKVFEQYDGGKCYLETAQLTINNDIAHLNQFDTVMIGGSLVHAFRVEDPNIVAPYLKYLQVTATNSIGEKSTASLSAVILGRRPRQTTFTSASPSIPFIILRDPPGDASYAYIEEGQTVCETWSFSSSDTRNTDFGVTVHLGPDIEVETGTPFLSTSNVWDATIDLGYTFNSNVTNFESNEMEMCITSTRTISTSESDFIVGSEMGGDVYVGGAMNFLYGVTDELVFDTANCRYLLDKGMFMFPQGFATTFIYTEYFIKNNVIPALTLLGDTTSVKSWQKMIADNEKQKKEAVFSKNLSFDAGVVYEESETTENSKTTTNSWVQSFSNGFTTEFGLTLNGLGASTGFAMNWTKEESKDTSKTTTNSRTVGYVLADDDPGDNITVNIKKDKTYATPVFETVSGQTQCPHEPNTQPREGVDLAADKQVAINVPMNEPAVFKLLLGNKSQSEETKAYTVSALQETNPNGAIILFNGQPSLNLGIPFGESVEVTMTVARGPMAFSYENLVVGFYSDCESERAGALDIPTPDGFNKELEFDVYFLEPCSPVDVHVPMQNWVVTPSSGDTMLITLDEFNRNDTDLELIRVQYRRKQGDGAWINIVEVPKAELDNDVFKIVRWVTRGLKDGEYEIRAVTQCTGGLNAGVSTVVSGRIERQAPELFGTPEPADGVLSLGDEISITFNELIKCDELVQADFFKNNNIGLYNSTTGELIDAVISCNRDKIVIVPNVPNHFIENTVLRVQVNNIKDLVGNAFLEKKWEFFVDRNPLRWVDDQIDVVKQDDDVITETRKLENIGGQALLYDLQEIPSWVKVFPTSGTLAPGGSQNIVFQFDDPAPLGEYLDTIYANGPLGAEPLYLNLRVTCPSPTWSLIRENYSFSMNMTLELNVEGVVSQDRMDIVAAFVGRELRGLGKVQYIPQLRKYLVFLTVYSNIAAGETITFQVWDASACELYGATIESFTFEADGLIGSPVMPQALRTNNQLLAKIPIRPGWNWISYNVGLIDPAINKGLESLSSPQGGLIKGQTAFGSYSSTLKTWAGSLKNLSHLTMYQYQSASVDSLLILGAPVNPSTPIPVVSGWNWIGFLPQHGMSVSKALESLTPSNGDLVKGRFAFAQYVPGVGWIGNLSFMSSPNGYLLKVSNPGALVYPGITSNNLQSEAEEKGKFLNGDAMPFSYWKVKPESYEQSMNIIAVVERPGQGSVLDEGDEIGAFFREEVRGSSQVIYVDALDAYLVFLTVYANREGEPIRFRYYDASEAKVIELNETLVFRNNGLHGLIDKPILLTPAMPTQAKSLEGLTRGIEVFPNPADETAFLQFHMKERQPLILIVTDALGREVWRMPYEAVAGRNILEWQINAGISPGWYFATLIGKSGVKTVKIEVVK